MGLKKDKAVSVDAADALIAAAKQPPPSRLSAEARAQLSKLLDHNDRAPVQQRVTADAACGLLASFGLELSESAFRRLILAEFGRKWGSK